nr:hypothetical protein [Tanacetum cinerariifolium]
VDNTKTRRPQPRSNTKNDKVPSASKSYPDLFMVRRLGLFQAHDRKSKASHQFRLKVYGNCPLRNDHVAAILGFGDLQWGNILITGFISLKEWVTTCSR